MEKLNITSILISFLIISMAGSYDHVNARELGSHSHPNLCLGTQKVTKLRFYIQDISSGDKPTVWKVVSIPNFNDTAHSSFGQLNILDDLITSGIDADSGEVGRLQGVVGFADLDEMAATVLLNIFFTKGEYNGSTLSIVGRNPLLEKVREVPIVGGTGAFRMARGYAFTSSISNVDNVIQYDVVVYHFEGQDSLADASN